MNEDNYWLPQNILCFALPDTMRIKGKEDEDNPTSISRKIASQFGLKHLNPILSKWNDLYIKAVNVTQNKFNECGRDVEIARALDTKWVYSIIEKDSKVCWRVVLFEIVNSTKKILENPIENTVWNENNLQSLEFIKEEIITMFQKNIIQENKS